MVIEITRREVLNNLIRLKDNLLEMGPKEKSGGKERVYRALLNRRTGDMRFAQKISTLEHHFPKNVKGTPEDWKEVHLIVGQKSKGAPVHFELRDGQDKELQPSDLEPLARRIVKETIDVLNVKGKEVHETSPEVLPEESVLRDLSSIHLSTAVHVEDLPGWLGVLSRGQAEAALRGKPPGTYLLREGEPLTQAVAVQLSISNGVTVAPYVLTYAAKEKKISEILLLQVGIGNGWAIYNDEPNLKRVRRYPTVQEILRALSNAAVHPYGKKSA